MFQIKTMNKPRYDKELFKAVGQAINIRRLRMSLSESDMARRIRLSSNIVFEIESGLRNLSLTHLDRIGKVLGCTLSELFADAEVLIAHNRAAEGAEPLAHIPQCDRP